MNNNPQSGDTRQLSPSVNTPEKVEEAADVITLDPGNIKRVLRGEPLYGLAIEPGTGTPGEGGQGAPQTEAPVEEAASATDQRINLTWGIIFGGVLLLFMVAAILYLGIGNTYSSSPLTSYPLK